MYKQDDLKKENKGTDYIKSEEKKTNLKIIFC